MSGREFRPPRLDRLLTLEEAQRVADGAGGWATEWAPLGRHWAAVEARFGREGEAGGRERSRVSYRITVRGADFGAAARPRADQRMREGARAFLIRAVAEADRRGRYLLCWADEEAVQ